MFENKRCVELRCCYAVFSVAAPSLWLIHGCRESGRKGKLLTTFPLLWCPLEKLCSVWKAPAETQPAGVRHTVGIFFFCRVAAWNVRFFTAFLVFVFRMCKQKHSASVSARWRQSMTLSGGAGRCRRAVTAMNRVTESYWSHWLLRPQIEWMSEWRIRVCVYGKWTALM